jgi:glycosyltransferase involved in cell wall biosynthesis
MTGPPLLDLHDLGMRQTGNESWARSLGVALLAHGGPGSYDVGVTEASSPEDLSRLSNARERVWLSRSSTRRLFVDIPSAVRRLKSAAVLVQYTAPVSRVPSVVAVHDLSFEDARAREWLPRASRLRYRATVRASVRRAAHVVVDSEYTRQDLVRRYGTDPARVTVIPLAVEPQFRDLLRATPEQRCDRPTVLVVGNVLPRKNLPVVARAVRILRDRGEEVVLRVVGAVHSTGRADAERSRQLLGDDALTLTGYATPAALAHELRSAHVLAFPSLFEGFGIPVLEAMVAGVPVVVSDRTSLPDVAGSAGLVAPAEDPAAWAEALHQALQPGMAARLRAAGLARERAFTWDRSAAALSQALSSVV